MSGDHLQYQPTIRDVRDMFTEEVASLGGSIPDVYDDGHRLFARAVLPDSEFVQPGDVFHAGVAIRAVATEILVYPYVFRQVCSNGAIITHALAGRRVERIGAGEVFQPTYEATVSLDEARDGVRECASHGAFSVAVGEFQTSISVPADHALQLLRYLAHMPGPTVGHLLPEIFGRFGLGEDRSAFGVVNAVTAVARDTEDPETRWNLEVLGAKIAARVGHPSPSRSDAFAGRV